MIPRGTVGDHSTVVHATFSRQIFYRFGARVRDLEVQNIVVPMHVLQFDTEAFRAEVKRHAPSPDWRLVGYRLKG